MFDIKGLRCTPRSDNSYDLEDVETGKKVGNIQMDCGAGILAQYIADIFNASKDGD